MNQVNMVSEMDKSTYLPHTLLIKHENENFYYYNYIGRMLSRLNPNNLYKNFDEELIPYINEYMPKEQPPIT
ncbi:MAG: hypothetical protein KAQ94_02800 [Arcobacteraceae bacterium]|nr:hypothetical protein [Arcobacteraceae bacterium]